MKKLIEVTVTTHQIYSTTLRTKLRFLQRRKEDKVNSSDRVFLGLQHVTLLNLRELVNLHLKTRNLYYKKSTISALLTNPEILEIIQMTVFVGRKIPQIVVNTDGTHK